MFDGVFLEAQRATLFAEGRVNAVPTLLGSNLLDNDAVFLCPTRSAARALTNQGAPVFRYHFTRANDTG